MGTVDEKQDISLLWHNRQLINTVQSFSYTAKITCSYQYTSIAIPVSSSGTIRRGRGSLVDILKAMQLLANFTAAVGIKGLIHLEGRACLSVFSGFLPERDRLSSHRSMRLRHKILYWNAFRE